METGLYELKLKDGRLFRVFTANKKQRERLQNTWRKIGGELTKISNGIHDIKQFENIIERIV